MFFFRCDKNFRIEGVGARMDSTMLGSNGTSASDLYTRVMVDLRDPRWSIIDADDEVDTHVDADSDILADVRTNAAADDCS